MIRDLARAFVLVMFFLIVVAEVERMDNEVTTDWSQQEEQSEFQK